jgi:hypothetical protein
LESGSQSLWGAHEGAIIEVPGIEREVGQLSLDLFDERMEGWGKPQRARRVPLLDTATAANESSPRRRNG